jgi:hypothetical protein
MITDILEISSDYCPSFTVDNTQSYVKVVPVSGAVPFTLPYILKNGSGKYRFHPGEAINIISIGYIIPENFLKTEISSDALSGFLLLRVLIEKDNGDTYYIQGFEDGMSLPSENFESVINKFVNPISLHGTSISSYFNLSLEFIMKASDSLYALISMINVPDKLNGRVFKIRPFVKVEHSWELSA